MKINGAMPWLLSVFGALVTAGVLGGNAMLWNVTTDVSSIKTTLVGISERVDRQDSRNAKEHDVFDERLRDVELGDR